jgi:AraC-type DNA-binding domain-containing proteins
MIRPFSAVKPLPHVNKLFYLKLRACLDENLNNPELSASMVSNSMSLSKSTLNRKLKELGKPTINEFIKDYRLQEAIIILAAGYKIREVSHRVGFKSPSYFSQCFKAQYHKTPRAFAKSMQMTQK